MSTEKDISQRQDSVEAALQKVAGRMKQCVEIYQGNETLAPLVRLLGWTRTDAAG